MRIRPRGVTATSRSPTGEGSIAYEMSIRLSARAVDSARSAAACALSATSRSPRRSCSIVASAMPDLPQLLESFVDIATRRFLGRADRFANLAVGQVAGEAQQHRRPLLGRQVPHGAPQLDVAGPVHQRLAHALRQLLDRDGATATGPM